MNNSLRNKIIFLFSAGFISNIILDAITNRLIWIYFDNQISSINRKNPRNMDELIRQSEQTRDLVQNINSIVIFTITLLVLYIFITRKIKYISEIQKSVRTVGHGNFGHKVEIRGKDELTSLALELNNISDKLDESSKREKELINDISHDLKTPLTSISGYAQLIQTLDIDKNVNDYCNKIINKTSEMTTHISNSLESTKTDEKAILSEVSTNTVISMIEDLDSSFEAEFKIEKINTINTIINVNEQDLKRIIENILSNASKYSTNQKVDINFALFGNYFELTVSNLTTKNVIANMEKLTTRYYKVDQSRTDTTSNGLGLSIVEKLSKKNNIQFKLDKKELSFIVSLRFEVLKKCS